MLDNEYDCAISNLESVISTLQTHCTELTQENESLSKEMDMLQCDML